jgi:hypothetical protein
VTGGGGALGRGRIVARPDRRAYGMGLGVILVDDVYPAFPGDVRNASAYPFPLQYDVAEGVDILELVRADDKAHLLAPIVASARRLERIGVRAIVGECGYFAWFQEELAAAVDIPVFASSLLQVPLAQLVVGPRQVVGVLVATQEYLRDRHLTAVGVTLGTNYVVASAMDGGRMPDFQSLWNADVRPELPTADYDAAERDLVAIARDFAAAHPDMGAMVLECTGFPPFGAAIQRAIGMPVFSWSTLLEFAYSSVVHREFAGHV